MTNSTLSAARARFRERLASANGEFHTPLKSVGLTGGRDLEIHSSAPPMEVGEECVYVRDPSALCLSLIGGGDTCCLNNGSNCPVASHKGGNKFPTAGYFFMQLHKGASAKKYVKGYTTSYLMLSGEADAAFKDSMLAEEGVDWKTRFDTLQNLPDEELTCSAVDRLEMLTRTAIKLRPDLKEKPTADPHDDPESGDLSIGEEIDRIEALAQEMLAACIEGSSSTCPKEVKDKVTDENLKAVSDEVFIQLYKLLDIVGSLSGVVAFIQEDNKEVFKLKELVEGISLSMRSLKNSIGHRRITTTLPLDIWTALEELEGMIEEKSSNLGQKLENVEAKVDLCLDVLKEDGNDGDSEMNGCDAHSTHNSPSCGEHECCPTCTTNFKRLTDTIEELKLDNTRLHRKLEELDREAMSSEQVGTFSVQGLVLSSRHDVSALLLEWFPDAADLDAAFFPTPHLIWNLVWSNVSNNQNGMRIPFSDSDLLKMKINKRSAEAFYSTKSYLPQFMTADSMPSGFPAKSTKAERALSQAFKSIPTALDFGRSGDSDYLHGKFRKALRDVESQYRNYLEQKLFSHDDSKVYLIAKQCLDDAVDHIGLVLEFMEDQNYRNVRSFGNEKKTLAWNLVSACVKDVYELHFKGCIDLVVSTDLSDMQEVSVDVTYAALALNQLVRDLNRIGLKHHPSVSSSQLRFVMESYAESGDDSAKIKKLEKDNEKLVKIVEKMEDEMEKLKRKHGDLSSVVTNMKKNKRARRAADDEEEI